VITRNTNTYWTYYFSGPYVCVRTRNTASRNAWPVHTGVKKCTRIYGR